MKKINYLLIGLAMIGLFALSCSKDGAQGPEGPTGQTGQQGAVGPAGPIGPNGKAGSVIYSGTTLPEAALGAVGDYYLNSSTSLLYGPKTASGWGTAFSLKGSTGATGASGAAGATGATGAAGTPGSKILSGSGIPAASLGAIGDYYLDKINFMLYGPKIVSGWGPAVSLQGPAGTANVLYSGWNYASNFRDTIADNTNMHAADLSAPALSADYLGNAVYQVYFTFGGGVYTLPYTSYAGGKLNTMSYFPRLKHFIITRFTADNSSGLNSIALSTLLQYRYVIIPGGTKLMASKHIDINNYEEVRKFFRIPD
ncbi:hypothetical protein DBR11_07135 [Pedobacter sp. HMWF019]|uniref:collagen-like protein n=1 Tax=Pedobacter sp. HMWF019 TaxID=2056856 RepID=UPI000D37B16E|nr:collagen-like protein [Pedobacter sp. HMWF019]PTT01522.1 hypothetical protein DBR11_07135 [Pedobacter sp. HMWF019]